ncbi:MAG: hypothetical protein RI958_3093 [Actinomycetota bacterium]|jgi:thiamine kinase-like enzyme
MDVDAPGSSGTDAMAVAVGGVSAWRGRPVDIGRLGGGITNHNFVVTVDGEQFVVRIPGEHTELLGIDRTHEAVATRQAAELGIAPEVVGELPGVGTLITRLAPGLSADDRSVDDRLEDVVDLLTRFHHSGTLPSRFPVHRVVERHARDAATRGVTPPPAFEHLQRRSRAIEAAFARSADRPVPCHNDLLPANVLVGDDRVWLIDFEYAGMNDAFFDLANLSINCGFDPGNDERLLRHRFGAVTNRSWARLQLMKVMSEFREGMWAVVQQVISSIDTDFATYASERLERAEHLAARPEFTRWLEAATAPQ